uniref:Uncharacterized protein n=1 Tax=Pithovirus LCPAC403 TaxID=2506596 RepID=A0A481ZBG1_9VIRU|nr:MAG: uncharacterized protein LCPAC403_02510 [Pithovirus LCPAC403]
MAKLVGCKDLVNYRAIKECMISRGYSQFLAKEFAERLHLLDDKTVAMFCTHTHSETNMGFNSHWFASKLKNVVDNWDRLLPLVTSCNIFPEGKDNPVLNMRDLELSAMENALEEASNSCKERPIITSEHSYYAESFTNLCEENKFYFVNWYLQKTILVPEYREDGTLLRINKVPRDRIVRLLAKGKCKSEHLMKKLHYEVLMLRRYQSLI